MDSKGKWIIAYEKRLLQTLVCLGLGCFSVIGEWRHALLLCFVLGLVVLWVWIRRQSIEIVDSAMALQDLVWSAPVGTSRRIPLGDGAGVTLHVRLPRRGAGSTSRQLFVRTHGAVTAHTMSMSDAVAQQVLDAIESSVGSRPRVVNS